MSDQGFTREQLESAFIKADDAGNVEDAKAFADALRAMNAAPTPAPQWNPENTPQQVAFDTFKKVGEGIAQPFIHPIDTAVTIGKAVAHPIETVKNVAGNLNDKYGSLEKIRNSFVEDPSGVLSEVGGLVVGGAGAVKGVALAAPKVARGLAAASEEAAPLIKAIPKEIAPTDKQVFAKAKNAFEEVDNSGVRISPESFQSFADQIGGNLKGYNPKMTSRAPETNQVLGELKNYANEEDTIKFSELADLKSTITDSISSTSTKPNDKRLLRQIGDQLDGYMRGLQPQHLDVGDMEDLTKAQGALDTARDLWHKQAKMAEITDIMSKASRRKYPDRYIQQKFIALADNTKRFSKFTPDEQKIITDVAKGGKLDTVAKWLAPEGDRIGGMKALFNASAGAGTGAALFGLPGAIGAVLPAAVGYGAKAITEAGRRAGVKTLQDTIALGRPRNTYLQRLAAQRALLRGNNPEQ